MKIKNNNNIKSLNKKKNRVNGTVSEFVNRETGEAAFGVFYSEEVLKKQAEAEKRRKDFLDRRLPMDPRGDHIRAMVETWNDLYEILEDSGASELDLHNFVKVMRYFDWKSRTLKIENRDLENKDLERIWNVHGNNVIEYAKNLERANLWVINKKKKKDENGNHIEYNTYIPNDRFFLKGSGRSKELHTKIFQEKLSEIIERLDVIENKKVIKKTVPVLSLLFAILRNCHYLTLYVVTEVNVRHDFRLTGETTADALYRNPDALKPLTKTAIGRLVKKGGMDIKTINKYLGTLNEIGAVTTVAGGKFYVVHPDLFFRETGSYGGSQNDFVKRDYNQPIEIDERILKEKDTEGFYKQRRADFAVLESSFDKKYKTKIRQKYYDLKVKRNNMIKSINKNKGHQ